jgi:uncharacterized protein (DUF983 family)
MITVVVEIGDHYSSNLVVRWIGSEMKGIASDAANFCDGCVSDKLFKDFLTDGASCSCENDLHDRLRDDGGAGGLDLELL